ncbi:hypothetical protein SDC9_87192 [bioreactor metagenome]|uniref:Sporulation stage II protein D amidase enhancer LytB N-terminal domain-containing protein n=1 Tax=bioreactor metagenome TaxID=1076179 RepID=A0A644ZJP6_9ZZZZ
MRGFFSFLVIVYAISGIMPAMMLSGADYQTKSTQAAQVFAENGGGFDENTQITVADHKTGQVQSMSFLDYLEGVISAEMPAGFEPAALQAQAICARSYALYKIQLQEKYGQVYDSHHGAQVCTDSDHCAGFMNIAERKELWGDSFELYRQKIAKAIADTDGLVAIYQEEPICAVFHSTYTDKTEDSINVWGREVDYLKSVSNPGQDQSPRDNTAVEVTQEEYKNRIRKEYNEADFTGENLVEDMKKSDAGTVLSVKTGGVDITGGKMREIFGLPSSSFDISMEKDKVVFEVKGYGHGVGLNQYGAQYLAKQGYNCEEIIKWYFTGVEIKKYTSD